jgi:hypothetical protein
VVARVCAATTARHLNLGNPNHQLALPNVVVAFGITWVFVAVIWVIAVIAQVEAVVQPTHRHLHAVTEIINAGRWPT